MPATLLGLSLVGGNFTLSEYAARGIKMSLQPIDAAGFLARDVNGNMLDLSSSQFRKYRANISCSDQESPGFAAMTSDNDPIWPGDIFTVTVLPQLGSADPLELTMMVVAPGWQETRDEWGAVSEWQLDLEEV